MKYINHWFKNSHFYPVWCTFSNKRKQNRQIRKWRKRGCPPPPPHLVKQKNLLSYAKRYDLKVFVETGTYKGDMIESMKNIFHKIYSIELCPELYSKASERFQSYEHIVIVEGDSSIEIGNVLEKINEQALFWLDGHYSAGATAKGEKDTPVMEKLESILNSKDLGHVIVIDDARCFGTDPAYPTFTQFSEFILSKRPDAQIRVQDDSIRVLLR